MLNSRDRLITARDLLLVAWRTLLIQASWSYERMQALGFAYAIEPVLRKIYRDNAAYEERLKIHLEYFNTQPYLASFILGGAIRMEEERATHGAAADTAAFKASLMSPLGAIGDSFFWGSFKPFVAIAAAALLMTGSWWSPVLFVIVYNVMHVGLRVALVFWGYATTGDAVVLMTRYGVTRMAKAFKTTALCLVGGLLGMLPAWRPEFIPPLNWPHLLLSVSALGATFILVLLLKRGLSPVVLMLGLAAFSLLLSVTGVIP